VADFILALVLLLATAPVVLASALLVWLTSPGPGFYRQRRVGLRGRQFTICKLRTMAHDCERDSGATWSKVGDPRITPVGRFLRRTHLDELPQLWNVLRGDMSLIGPRPERPEFVAVLMDQLPHYRLRLAVRPGLTGLAQVQLPPDTDIRSVRRKLACDLYYVRNRRMWLDVRILAATGFYLAGVPTALTLRILRLPGPDLVEESLRGSASDSVTVPQLRTIF
jgi:lipopolysaccharide/colanic/teichoic acid biosynthesis glycosyltransferase